MNEVTLHKRPEEGSRWEIADSRDLTVSYGDLILVVDAAYVNPLSLGEYGDLYVANKDSKLVKAPNLSRLPSQTNWLYLWNGQDVLDVEDIIEYGCRKVDRKRLVMAACEISKLGLPLVHDKYIKIKLQETIEATEKWVANMIVLRKVIDARNLCWEYYTTNNAICNTVISAVSAAVSTAFEPSAEMMSSIAAHHIMKAYSPKDISNEMLYCLTKYVPLYVAILAELGDVIPL